MKYFILLFIFKITLFACSGDCASCHFNIDYKDSKHHIMLNCKICHTDEKLAKTQMQDSCGQDCFNCHSIEKINAIDNEEHQALNTCISCHSSLKSKNKFNLNTHPSFNNLLKNNLQKDPLQKTNP